MQRRRPKSPKRRSSLIPLLFYRSEEDFRPDVDQRFLSSCSRFDRVRLTQEFGIKVSEKTFRIKISLKKLLKKNL